MYHDMSRRDGRIGIKMPLLVILLSYIGSFALGQTGIHRPDRNSTMRWHK